MKKTLLFLFSLFVCGSLFSQTKYDSDINLYKEISQSYENKYYPGTIEKADLLQQLYPDSVFTQQALFYKAQALIDLTYYEDAVITLKNAISYMHTGKDGYARCHYLLGTAYYYLNDFENAITSFYVSCKAATLNNENDIYNLSIFYSAECYYNMEQFNNAVPLYEYVIENGKYFSKADYITSAKKLLISYNKTENYSKTIDLYNSLKIDSENKDFFDNDSKLVLKLSAAESYEKSNLYNDAYNIYSQVIQSGNENYAVIALKNAYILTENKKINVSLGELFSKTASTFENNQNVVNEFWIRLGIDEYNNKSYKKAFSYFNNVPVENDIIKIYKVKIILDTDSSINGGIKAEEILNTITLNDMISDSYYSLMLQSKIQQNIWDNVPEIFGKINNPDYKDIYINSSYYYKNGEYDKVSPETGELYCSALVKLGQFEKACNEFEKLAVRNQLTSEALSEYSKALFITGHFEKAGQVILESNDDHKNYIAGLCKINTGDFEAAKDYFISYIKKMSNNEAFIKLALYYKGYVEYSLGDFKNAYTTFVRFANEADDIYYSYIRNSHYYSAVCALQNKDYEKAGAQAAIVVKMSLNEADKIKAVIFNFDILKDSGKYDEAVAIMSPYALEKSDFTPEALFRIASVYSKQGNAKLADETYRTIYKDYPNSKFAEESMYRCGEVFYFVEDYVTAYNRFNDYIYKYVSGTYLDGALYFSGDCALKLGETSKAIMINKNLNAKFPESIYSYGANKNLLTAYYEIGEYEDALKTARFIMKLFPEQAASDNIGTRIIELEKIVGGTDSRIVEKLSKYEAAGGSKTRDGRIIGSELVKLYGESYETQSTAYGLAVELLENQKEADEFTYAAENAEFAGDYCRSIQENKKAADFYLKAAQLYRSVQNSNKAAAVLYSATEAFAAAELNIDAKETADLLIELYPDSNYAQRVHKIVR